MWNWKGPKKEKIPPTPGFELQASRCLFRATLSSAPGGMDFFSLNLKYLFFSDLKKMLKLTKSFSNPAEIWYT